MKKSIGNKIINIATILWVCVMVLAAMSIIFISFRSVIISPQDDNLCIYKYGEDFRVDKNSNFGLLCVELDFENFTVKNTKKYPAWNETVELCGVPRMFNLLDWNTERCHGEYGGAE